MNKTQLESLLRNLEIARQPVKVLEKPSLKGGILKNNSNDIGAKKVEKIIMDILSKLTDEELKNELVRREIAQKRAEAPQPLQNPDWKPLIQLLEDNILRRIEESRSLKDIDHNCFETAMECLYGSNVWLQYNKLT